jgi:hypothetical protein
MGRLAIHDWRKAKLSPSRCAIMDTLLDRIAKMQSWPIKICGSLKNHPGCSEIRWTAEHVEHRIFGYIQSGNVFVMLVGCTHKGKVYDPPSAFDTMDDRKNAVEAGRAELCDYDIWSSGEDEG